MREVKLPTETTTFRKMSEQESTLWSILRSIKENGGTSADKPEGESKGERFCEKVEEYIALSEQISALEAVKKDIGSFLYSRLVARSLGIVVCDVGTVTIAAYTKEVQDTEYLKEKCPEAFAVIPDRLQIRVTKSK